MLKQNYPRNTVFLKYIIQQKIIEIITCVCFKKENIYIFKTQLKEKKVLLGENKIYANIPVKSIKTLN